MRDIRVYKGCNIWPKNVHGLYCSYVIDHFIYADTLEGMKQFIAHELKKG